MRNLSRLLFVLFIMLTVNSTAQRTGKPEEDVANYAGKVSVGVGIGGGGIVGVPLRIYPTPTFGIEIGGYFRPFILINDDYFTIEPGVMLAGGFLIYTSESIVKPLVAKSKGFSIKGGHSFGKYPESFGALAWAMERTKWSGNNLGIEIGGGALILDKDVHSEYSLTKRRVRPMIYFKIQLGIVLGRDTDNN